VVDLAPNCFVMFKLQGAMIECKRPRFRRQGLRAGERINKLEDASI